MIGRYVLIHQAAPSQLIRAAAAQLRSGGIIAFHEAALYGNAEMLPPLPLWNKVWDRIISAFQSVLMHPDAAGRMVAHFEKAGLDQPRLFYDRFVGGGMNKPFFDWIETTVRSLLPQIEKIGAATPDELDIDTLGKRLRRAVLAVHGQILGPAQICGWVRV